MTGRGVGVVVVGGSGIIMEESINSRLLEIADFPDIYLLVDMASETGVNAPSRIIGDSSPVS